MKGCPAPAAGVVVEDLDDDLCLYRPEIDEVLVLNRPAADVWRMADGATPVTEIARLLTAAYLGNGATVARDVDSVVTDLVARGYLRWPTEPPDTEPPNAGPPAAASPASTAP